MNSVISVDHESIAKRCRQHGVERLSLFGSVLREVVQKRDRRNCSVSRARFKMSGTAHLGIVSCGFSLVMTQQPAQQFESPDGCDLVGVWRRFGRAGGNGEMVRKRDVESPGKRVLDSAGQHHKKSIPAFSKRVWTTLDDLRPSALRRVVRDSSRPSLPSSYCAKAEIGSTALPRPHKS